MYYGDFNSLYASYVPTYMNSMSYNYSIQQCCCSSNDMLDKIYGQQSNTNTTNNYQYRNSYDNIAQSQQEEIEDSITNYMDKEFLYESELKKIEEKFDFKFEHLNDNWYEDKDYPIIKKILDANDRDREIFKICDYEKLNEVTVYYNAGGWKDIHSSFISKDKNYLESLKNKCNAILKIKKDKNLQLFYEKFKNRIVKDNRHEDNSYWYKILEE